MRTHLPAGAAILCLLAPGAALAAAEPAPVNLDVKPPVAVPGTTVTLKGSTGIDAAGATTLRIVVTPPQGPAVTLTAALDRGGEFTATFASTRAVGTYKVVATSPGGSGSATASFAILPPAGAFQASEQEFAALFPVAEQGLDRVGAILAPLPESADKAQAERKLQELKGKLREAQQRVGLGRIVKPLQDHLAKFPAAGAKAVRLFEALGQWQGESRQERIRIREELLRSGKSGETCEAIDRAIEALNLVSFLLNLVALPVSICANFAQDLLASKLADAGAGDAGGAMFKAALNQMKVESTTGEWILGSVNPRKFGIPWTSGTRQAAGNNLLGFAFDLSNLFLKGYYGKFCERMEGALTGKMVGTVYQGSRPYWKFSVGLRGKLVLRYAKPEAGQAIRVRGQFIGFGTDFYVYEDIVGTLFSATVRQNRAITFHKVVTPVVSIASDEWNLLLTPQGAIPQTLMSPTAFYIPVEGDLVKDTLTLRIQPARFDFNEKLTAARALYFLVGPRGSEFINNALPYKNAHFILTRALNAETTGTATLKVKVDAAKKSTSVAGDFKRGFKSDDGGAEASYTLSVKACNPPCLQ